MTGVEIMGSGRLLHQPVPVQSRSTRRTDRLRAVASYENRMRFRSKIGAPAVREG